MPFKFPKPSSSSSQSLTRSSIAGFGAAMGRGKFKAKPTGRRQFSTPEEISAGTSARPRTFRSEKAEVEEELEEEVEDGSGEESDDETDQRRKGTEGIIEIENPNLVKPKLVRAKDIDIEKITELSRR